MGQELDRHRFTDQDHVEFLEKLRQETKLLKKWFDEREFEYLDQATIGLEVEAWLVDENGLPAPKNEEFLQILSHPDLVHELSQFNFEMNVDPCHFGGNCLSNFLSQLKNRWSLCRKVGEQLSVSPCLVGILPTVRDEMLQLEYISKSNRYRALNDELMRLRRGQPMDISIKGIDHLELTTSDLMLEAAATSVQVHLQANQENAKRLYNASVIASAPVVGISANSPFLYGKQLWDETRIPAFEQAISVSSFRDKKGQSVGRVTFGTGYIRHSLLELFLENLDGYSTLLPLVCDSHPEEMNHLKLQNGCVWRWNRPIVGFSKKGQPHLRIEHRVMAAGPTLVDIVANTAFYLGLTQFLASEDKAPEESFTFTDCRNNFYEAAKNSLNGRVRWFGKEVLLQELILKELLPKARDGLLMSGVDIFEIEFYLDEILYQRVLKGQTGSQWQKSFVEVNGPDFQGLIQKYLENQNTDAPVHSWTL